MEQSPLAQQQRPETFTPKIVGLYEALFKDEQLELQSEGFWNEFFLLKPDSKSLSEILTNIGPDDLLNHHQSSCQELFHRAIRQIRLGKAPSDEIALDTLVVFLECVLNKRYASPSADIITILASLEGVDTVFTEYVSTLDTSIREGRTLEVRQKSVRVAIATVSGAYQTGLVSYFINKDLFPSLMKIIYEADTPIQGFDAFALLGLLVNYNKFEFQNPYRLRFEDFVNDTAISKAVNCIGSAFLVCRDSYIAAQDDSVQGWTLGSTMQYIGLPAWLTRYGGGRPITTEEDSKAALAILPPPIVATLLSTYDFANANKLFCFSFANLQPDDKQSPSCFSAFLSFTSYLMQNAHRSERASLYLCLSLLTIRILLEDHVVAKCICTTESLQPIRLCRQRPPLLPLTRGTRIYVSVLIDIVIDGINHNLKKRLDVTLYQLLFHVLERVISFLNFSRIKLSFHWSELWRSLLSFLRFLNTYADQLKQITNIENLAASSTNVLATALSTGETFLPDASSHDDLFYKIVEIGEELPKLRDNYALSKQSRAASAMDVLVAVSDHYQILLQEQKGKNIKSLSPREVAKVINSGYETLSIESRDGLSNWERYREAEHKSLLKRIARVAVQDMRTLSVENRDKK